MSEKSFTYRLTAAALVVFVGSVYHYSGLRIKQEKNIKEIFAHSSDVDVFKNKLSGKRFARPASGVITTEYSAQHTGVDIASNNENEPIVAAADGVVVFSGEAEGYGNCVKIEHSEGLVTLYGHMREIFLAEGDSVKRGGQIGIMGNTGDSSGVHLHFETIKNGVYIDPAGLTEGL